MTPMNTTNERALTDESLEKGLPRSAGIAAIVAGALGVVGLVGCVAGIDSLRTPIPGTFEIRPTAALALMALAAALWLLREGPGSERRAAWGRFLAELVAAGAVLTLLEHAISVDLGIDRLVGVGEGGGRPSPEATIGVLLIALWFACIERRGRIWRVAEDVFAALAGVAIVIAAVGTIYQADYAAGADGVHGISPLATLGLLALWLGALFARPRMAWTRVLLSSGTGGRTLRRLVPMLIIVPPICGGIVIVGVENGAVSLRLGVAAVVSGAICVFVAVLVAVARELEELDDERLRLERKLIEAADRDPLTGVHNRRRLDEELTRLLALARRQETAVSVLSIDLDSFKPVNDRFGHATGDKLLVAIADVLRTELRASDFICRPGGDEFLILLADADEASAQIVALKLLVAFREVRVHVRGERLRTRASIGIASVEGGERQPQELLAAADRALYAAKEQGGDRFAVDLDLAAART